MIERIHGLEIAQTGIAEPNASGPLGGLRASGFEAANSAQQLQNHADTVWTFDETGYYTEDLFVGKSRREILYDSARAIAQYSKMAQIVDVIYLDRSARPMRVAVNEYERLAFADEPPTPAHFINPKVFISAAAEDSSPKHEATRHRAAETLANGLIASKSSLLEKKEQPVLLVDACLHTGETMFLARQALQDVGFNDVRTAAHSDDDRPDALISADVILSDDEHVCKPFGFDYQLEATDGIYSYDNGDALSRKASARLRQELRRLVRREFASERDWQIL